MSDDRPAPSPLETDFGWGLRLLSMSFVAGGEEAVADLPSGARGYLVLLAVSGEHPRSQLELARRLAVDRTAMTYLLDAMEEQGLVERKADPSDRRARLITITSSGRRALAKARRRLSTAEDRMLAALSDDEAETFRALLGRVSTNLVD